MHFKAPHFRQNIGHKVRVGVAITLFTGAFLLTSGIFYKAYSQEKKPKWGDTVQVYKSDGQAKTDTTRAAEYIPEKLRPYLKTLEYYVPGPLTLKDFSDLKNMKPEERENSKVELFRVPWRTMDDGTPFQLSKSVINSLSKEDGKLVQDKWDMAKTKLIVALTVQNGLTPEDALNPAKGGYDPGSAEVEKMAKDWNAAKWMDKRSREIYKRRSHFYKE